MRVSSNKGDAGFASFKAAAAEGKTVRIFLNGVEQKHCSMADDSIGQITRCVLDENGIIQGDPDRPGEVLVETVAGKVEIRFQG